MAKITTGYTYFYEILSKSNLFKANPLTYFEMDYIFTKVMEIFLEIWLQIYVVLKLLKPSLLQCWLNKLKKKKIMFTCMFPLVHREFITMHESLATLVTFVCLVMGV